MNTPNSVIIRGTKYESSGGALTPRSMVTQRWRSCDMSTIRIPLNSRKYPGLYALIDEADFELVEGHVVSVAPSPSRNRFDAKIYLSRGNQPLLHRYLLSAPEGLTVDHINGDTLDNRRCNLRLATHTQNAANRTKNRSNTSGYKGVFRRPSGRWAAKFQHDGKQFILGTFDSPQEAARAYDAVAIKTHGQFARVNFPKIEQ